VLERVGRQVGLAFQLRDDLIGLFGDDQRVGKDGGGDFYEGKRTFPVVAAHTRADAVGQAQLEALFHKPLKLPEDLGAAREAIDRYGGRVATQRVIDRMTRSAQRSLKPLPSGGGAREVLDALIGRLAQRQA
jgi:geranylgeranyl diphosphate synthase, type I